MTVPLFIFHLLVGSPFDERKNPATAFDGLLPASISLSLVFISLILELEQRTAKFEFQEDV